MRVRIPRPPAIHRPPMHPLAALSLLVNLAAAAAYPWGTDSCGPPIHGSGSSTDTTGLTIKMDGSKVVLASTRGSFKGFYMQATQNLAWSNTPAGARLSRTHLLPQKSHAYEGTTGSNVCGGTANTVFFQTAATAKSSVSANIACTVGQSFSITAYVVFSKSSAYVSMTSQVIARPKLGNCRLQLSCVKLTSLNSHRAGRMWQRHRLSLLSFPP